MSSSSCAEPSTPAAVDARTSQLTERLAAALNARGLRARVVRGAWVLVSNPAGDPPDDLRAKILNPGLRQTVMCGSDGGGRLTWYWQWSGPTRESPPEYEPICPADDIAAAADKITYVLRLVDDRSPGGHSREDS